MPWSRSRTWRRVWERVTGRADADLDRELRGHLELEQSEQVDAGLSSQQARDAARRAFGSVLLAKEDTRAAWGWMTLERRVRDVRIGLRGLWRTKWLSAAAMLTLAIGIGANTALFTVVDAVLLRALPYHEAQRLVMITQSDASPNPYRQFAPTTFFDWKQYNDSFTDLAMIQNGQENLLAGGESLRLPGQGVSANVFDLLGVQPLLGRTFTADDDRRGHENVLILSYGLWQTHFNGDPAIVGRGITFNGRPTSVIGVMPATFDLLDAGAAFWRPLALDPHARWNQGRDVQVIGRLRPGVPVAAAARDLRGIMDRVEQDAPTPVLYGNRNPIVPVPVLEYAVGDLRQVLLALWAAVACVLVIACTNVAALLLVRSSTRRHEMAVRGSLGATRGRLVAQLLTESVTLAVLGGGLGLLVAWAGVHILIALVPPSVSLPATAQIGPNLGVLAFTVGLVGAAGVLFGMVPAWRASNPALTVSLRQGGRGDVGGRGRLRGSAIIVEVALATVLLVCAGLLGRSLAYLRAVNPGFSDRHVLTVNVATSGPAYQTDPQRVTYFARLFERVRAVPGVRFASAIDGLPIAGSGPGSEVHTEGQPLTEPGYGTLVRAIGSQYFDSLAIPILQGRDLSDHDTADRPRVAVVNQAFVDRVFHGANPIGRHVSVFWGPQIVVEIVGVVGNVRYASLAHDEGSTLYWPAAQIGRQRLSLVIQTEDDPKRFAGAIASAIRSVDKDLPIGRLRPFEELRADASARTRFSVTLLGAFATISMVLALVGLFGVLAHGVAQRTPEIGLRLAVGADPPTIFRMILTEGMRLAIAGVLAGAASAVAVTRLLASQLSGVEPTDPVTFTSVALLVIGATFVAVCLPAVRAAHVDPLIALRRD